MLLGGGMNSHHIFARHGGMKIHRHVVFLDAVQAHPAITALPGVVANLKFVHAETVRGEDRHAHHKRGINNALGRCEIFFRQHRGK